MVAQRTCELLDLRAESWNTPQVHRVEWNPAQVLGCVHGVAASCLADNPGRDCHPQGRSCGQYPQQRNLDLLVSALDCLRHGASERSLNAAKSSGQGSGP